MQHKTQKFLSIFAGVASAGALFGAVHSFAAPPKLDAQGQKVSIALAKLLKARVSSPNNSLKINIVPTTKASSGAFSEITITGAPVQFKKLRVSEFSLRAKNVQIDVPTLLKANKLRTKKSTTTLRAVITEDDLTHMLAQGRHSKAMGLKVKYVGDKLSVTGKLNWTLINGPISGLGKLRMAPGHKVHLDILSLKLRGAEVPAFVKNQFSEKINPVIDYEDLPFNPPFKGVKVEGKKATVTT